MQTRSCRTKPGWHGNDERIGVSFLRAMSGILLLLILVVLCSGCEATIVGTKTKINPLQMPPPPKRFVGLQAKIIPVKMPPLAETVDTVPYLIPYSQHYRIGVLTFIDQTNRAEIVTDPIADLLTTSLYQKNRFSLYDRGDLKRQVLETEIQYSRLRASGRVDGILLGYVTAFELEGSKGSFEADVRLINQRLGLVIFSQNRKIRFTTDPTGGSVNISREDVDDLARSITDSFVDLDKLKEVRVVDINQDQGSASVILNVGRIHNIKQGFVGFVVETDTETKVENYLAKFVIQNVFKEASVGQLIDHCNSLENFSEETSIDLGLSDKSIDTKSEEATDLKMGPKEKNLKEKKLIIKGGECNEYDKVEALEQLEQIKKYARVKIK